VESSGETSVEQHKIETPPQVASTSETTDDAKQEEFPPIAVGSPAAEEPKEKIAETEKEAKSDA
jgi:hypothetical protein